MSDGVQLDKAVAQNKIGDLRARSDLAATEDHTIVTNVHDSDSYGGNWESPKSKRTRRPVDRLVVGDPKHFGKKSQKA